MSFMKAQRIPVTYHEKNSETGTSSPQIWPRTMPCSWAWNRGRTGTVHLAVGPVDGLKLWLTERYLVTTHLLRW